MDYLVALALSIIFPYAFNAAHINYDADFGVAGSLINENGYKLKLINNTGPTQYQISKSSVINAEYGVRPTFFLDYGVNINRFWIAPTIGFEPFNTTIRYTSVIASSVGGSGSETQFTYAKGPYMGLKLGYTVLKSDPKGNYFSGLGLTPYVTAAIQNISYEQTANFSSGGEAGTSESKYRFVWAVGSKIDFKGNWSAYVQYQQTVINSNGVRADYLPHPLQITEQQVQFGVAYRFISAEKKADIDSAINYNNIVNVLTPSFDGKTANDNTVVNADNQNTSTPTMDLMPSLSPLLIFPPSMLPLNNELSDSSRRYQNNAAQSILNNNMQLKNQADKDMKQSPIKKEPSPSDDNFNF
ncbi:outer membrane protein [Rickettsiales bacterium LUAb2]